MSAQPDGTRRWRALLAAGGIAVLLSGCAAGQVTSTAEIIPVIDGALATVGTMDLRAVGVAPPDDRSWAEGGTAPMRMFLVNNSAAPDQLVSVTSDRAASVQLVANGGVQASPSGPSASQPITVPSGESVSVGFDPGNPQVVLVGLTENLFPAQTISVTFRFANAGSVTTKVPVQLISAPSSTPTVNFSPSEGG